jgi:hypothetical protein
VFGQGWLRRLQNTLAPEVPSIHMEGLCSDNNEVVEPLRLPLCLVETNAIRRPVPCTVLQEATPVQEIPLSLLQHTSTVFPVLARHVLDADTWGSITGTVMLAVGHPPSFRVESPMDKEEGDGILSQFIDGLCPEGQEREVDQD